MNLQAIVGLVVFALLWIGSLVWAMATMRNQVSVIRGDLQLATAEIASVKKEMSESRWENGVITGCLYVIAATIQNPEMRDAVESMLNRQRPK